MKRAVERRRINYSDGLRLVWVHLGMSKVIRVRFERGVFKPLEPVELEENAELLVKIININERRRILDKYYGILGSASKELLDRFMLEAEEQ